MSIFFAGDDIILPQISPGMKVYSVSCPSVMFKVTELITYKQCMSQGGHSRAITDYAKKVGRDDFLVIRGGIYLYPFSDIAPACL